MWKVAALHQILVFLQEFSEGKRTDLKINKKDPLFRQLKNESLGVADLG